MEQNPYIEHQGHVVETDKRFNHVMAISLDPTSHYGDGVIRCITSREGDVTIRGYVDRSELHRVSGDSLYHLVIGDRLNMRNEDEITRQLSGENLDFIGLEDPDIFIDETTGLMHVYFTMPFLNKTAQQKQTFVHLGHAVGENLDSLEMTMPVLIADTQTGAGAKEVSIAPLNKQNVRLNLFESSKREEDFTYSTVRVAIAEDMGKPWIYGDIVFHPKEHKIPWIAGHASPGPLLPRTFLELGEGLMLGIMNGREANQKIGEKTAYGMFSVGLFVYDYETGKIEWVSPEPFIRDSQAKTITFASQFVETGSGSGILYAHVDDSFVRAYTLSAEAIRSLVMK